MDNKHRQVSELINFHGLKVLQLWKYNDYRTFLEFQNLLTETLGEHRRRSIAIYDREYGDIEIRTLRLFTKLRQMLPVTIAIVMYLDSYTENPYHGKHFLEVIERIAIKNRISVIVISRSPNEEPLFPKPIPEYN
jgi:hypothetical protein